MNVPDLTILVEPAEASAVVYGPLAGKTMNHLPEGQLSLVLTITNNEPDPVHLNNVTISFVGPPNVGPSAIAADLTIDPTQTKKWYFPTASNIILPEPAPGAVIVSLSCDTFSDPAQVSATLGKYSSPAAGGGYLFPAKAADLTKGEYWTGRSAKHGGAGGGTQMFAYDLLVRGYNESSQQWQTPLPGAAGTKNEDFRSWGKPIYAMADGTVVQFKNDMPDNTKIGKQDPVPDPVEGNHFYIQHGPDLALYAHFQKGTLNPAFLSIGAAVQEGDLLGICGNSGNSTEPHLHIQVNRTTVPWGGPPRPLQFRNMRVLDMAVAKPEPWPPTSAAPWNPVAGQALPSAMAVIWPEKLRFVIKPVWLEPLAWAWIIVIGGLMFTPGGIDCINCGPALTDLMGIFSIVLGGAGLARWVNGRLAAGKMIAPQIDQIGDRHG
ncbi:MAG: M23 family metallopeptidase [Thermoanaerobaculia bacterium]